MQKNNFQRHDRFRFDENRMTFTDGFSTSTVLQLDDENFVLAVNNDATLYFHRRVRPKYHSQPAPAGYIQILNVNTGAAVPFATIAFPKTNTGLNADESGLVAIKYIPANGDSVVISAVGYEPKTLMRKGSERSEALLFPKPIVLPTVVVKTRSTSNYLNDFSNIGSNFLTSSGSIVQYAQKFVLPESGALLSAIKIGKHAEQSKFRLRVYDVDTLTGGPGEELMPQPIVVSGRQRIVQVDVKEG